MEILRSLFKKIPFLKEFLLLGIIIIILLYPLILHPYLDSFPQTDVKMYSAWKIFLTDTFRDFGYIPLWNPYFFSGSSFIGNSQVGVFYPINIIYFLVPVDNAFGYVFLLDYFLIGWFTYLYARLIKLSNYSALITALCMVFNGAIMKQLFLGHIVILDSMVWFPLLIYLYEKLIRKMSIKYVILSGIAFSLMLLAGNPQIAFYSVIAVSLYLLLRLFFEKEMALRNKLQLISIPIITFLIGICLSAVQIIPTIEFSELSARYNGISYQFATNFSLHPKQIPAILFPSFFGSDLNNSYWGIGSFWSSSLYCGIIPFFLAAIALLFKRNKYILIFTFLSIVSVLYAFGRYFPLFMLSYDFVPFFNNFRVPTRSLFIYAFSFSILAGFGFDYILERLKQKKDLIFISKSIAIITFLSASLYLFLRFNKLSVSIFEKIVFQNSYAIGVNHNALFPLVLNDILIFTFFTFLISFLLLLFIKKLISRKIFLLLIFLFISIDFFLFYSKFYLHKYPETYNYNAEIAYLKQDKTKFRILSIPSDFEHLTSKNKIENLTGFDPLYLASYRNFLWRTGPHEETPFESFIVIHQIKNVNNLKLLNVKYVLSKEKITNRDLLEVFKSKYYIYEIQNTLPRAYINYSNSPDYVLRENTNDIGKVKITSYEPNKIVLQTSLNKAGYLILSEMYYPGWEAYDNGNNIQIEKSNKIFRAILLKEGNHRITFLYNPISFMVGKIVSLLSILFIAGFFAFSGRKLLLNAFNKYSKGSNRVRYKHFKKV